MEVEKRPLDFIYDLRRAQESYDRPRPEDKPHEPPIESKTSKPQKKNSASLETHVTERGRNVELTEDAKVDNEVAAFDRRLSLIVR